jgi:PST family polysaccharide transporter
MGAAPILSIFAIYAGLRSLSTHAGDLLKATGRANTLALLSVMKAAMLVPALFVGVRYGVVGVITAVTVVAAISTVVTLIVASRVLHTSLFTIGRSFAPSLAAGAIMTMALLGWLRAVQGAPAAVVVFGGVAAGAAVYAIALWLFDREIFASIVQRFFRRTNDLDDPTPAA